MVNKINNIGKKWKRLRMLGIVLIVVGFLLSILFVFRFILISLFFYCGLIIIVIGIIILFVNKFLFDKK